MTNKRPVEMKQIIIKGQITADTCREYDRERERDVFVVVWFNILERNGPGIEISQNAQPQVVFALSVMEVVACHLGHVAVICVLICKTIQK